MNMNTSMKPLRAVLGLSVLFLALAARAEAGEAAGNSTEQLESVEVKGERATVMSYARWVGAVKPIHELSGGQIREGVRLFSRDKGRALRVSVDDEQRTHAVPALLGELFVVPHDLTVDGEQAELSVNRADGRWGVGNFALVPQLAGSTPDMAWVRQVLRGYQTIYAKRFPLSWRLLSRSQASFDVCTPQAGAQLSIQAGDGATLAQLPLTQQPKEHAQTTGLPLYCASLRADAAWTDGARLVLPEHAVALLGFRLL